jgi:hypothetical protein
MRFETYRPLTSCLAASFFDFLIVVSNLQQNAITYVATNAFSDLPSLQDMFVSIVYLLLMCSE